MGEKGGKGVVKRSSKGEKDRDVVKSLSGGKELLEVACKTREGKKEKIYFFPYTKKKKGAHICLWRRGKRKLDEEKKEKKRRRKKERGGRDPAL